MTAKLSLCLATSTRMLLVTLKEIFGGLERGHTQIAVNWRVNEQEGNGYGHAYNSKNFDYEVKNRRE